MSLTDVAQGSLYGLLIGTNGTGKTTILKKIADQAARSGGRVLIIPADPAEPTFQDVPSIQPDEIRTFTGMKKIMCYEVEHFALVAREARNLTMISDDFRNYIPEAKMHKDVRKLFITRRYRYVNIYLACHGFTQVPPEMFTWCNLIFLFKTIDGIKRHRDKFMDLKAVVDAQERVNLEARENKYHYEIIMQQ